MSEETKTKVEETPKQAESNSQSTDSPSDAEVSKTSLKDAPDKEESANKSVASDAQESKAADADKSDSSPEADVSSKKNSQNISQDASDEQSDTDADNSSKAADAEQVKGQLKDASGEVERLKQELSLANKKKEAAFQKKQEVGSQIAEKIREITDYKSSRNSLTEQVRDLKKQRDALNDEINTRVNEIKELTQNKDLPKLRSGGKNSPPALKQQIEKLEYRLETQPMGFEAEQRLNKQIRDLRKQYDEKMKAFEGMEHILAKSKEIDRLKREANKLHAQVTKIANDSQKRHESLIETSKEIEELKSKEDELYKTFLEFKKEYSEINAKLRNKLGVVHEKRDIVRKERQEAKKKKAAEDKKTLKERAKEAEEKVKKKQKLTTEDLLALQGMK